MDVKKTVKDFVGKVLAENSYQGNIGDDDSLIDSGILDSLTILELISFLDEKFGIIPAENELDSTNFDTIDLIHKFIEDRLSI